MNDKLKTKSGYALFMAIILLALMTGPVFHALLYDQVLLRHAESARKGLELRAAVQDAVLGEMPRTLQRLAETRGGQGVQFQADTPSGVHIQLSSRTVNFMAVPGVLRGTRGGGTYYLFQGEAQGVNRLVKVDAYLVKESDGHIHIIAWLEG